MSELANSRIRIEQGKLHTAPGRPSGGRTRPLNGSVAFTSRAQAGPDSIREPILCPWKLLKIGVTYLFVEIYVQQGQRLLVVGADKHALLAGIHDVLIFAPLVDQGCVRALVLG